MNNCTSVVAFLKESIGMPKYAGGGLVLSEEAQCGLFQVLQVLEWTMETTASKIWSETRKEGCDVAQGG